jgi:regulator of protease activity HflC (stomatin/prohibitin superfamily)
MDFFVWVLCFLIIIFVAILLSSFFTVEQQNVFVIERFGKFARLAYPGLNLKIPIFEKISGKVSLRIQQLNVRAETKTKDNVFVHVVVSVQYIVNSDRIYDAFYKLDDPTLQINSYVFDVVRARVPQIILDNLFEQKDEIALAIKNELNETMDAFGFVIVNSLVTDIEPDMNVKAAMNEINAAERLKYAAEQKAEAEKIMKVKAAEADAQSKALQGKGIADQRSAIIIGLKESVEGFKEGVPGTTAKDVMNLVLMTQYFDTLKEVGANSNTILIPHSPGGMNDIASQIRNAFIEAQEVSKKQTI